jgi:hypothetical protein
MRTAAQRQPPKRPRKPSSQALGARSLSRQNWRKAASLMWPTREGAPSPLGRAMADALNDV